MIHTLFVIVLALLLLASVYPTVYALTISRRSRGRHVRSRAPYATFDAPLPDERSDEAMQEYYTGLYKLPEEPSRGLWQLNETPSERGGVLEARVPELNPYAGAGMLVLHSHTADQECDDLCSTYDRTKES